MIKSWNDCTSLHKAISGNEQQMRFKWQHSARLPDRTHHQHRDYGTACLSAATVAGRCSNRHVGGDLLLPVCHLERPSALHQKIRSIHSNFHYDCHVLSGGNLPEIGQAYPPECDLENLATTRQRELMRPFSQRQMDRRAVLLPDLSLAASDFLRTLPIIRANAATAMRSA
nr:hypothetical protein [Desulfuromonas acetoxidans]